MIGTIDIAVNAHRPQMPLDPLFAYKDSPSNIRIRNVPREIGSWELTSVFVETIYPSNVTLTKSCKRVGGVYVCTIDGSTQSGISKNGFTVYANGVDENNSQVSGYVLGKGDVYILSADGTISPDVSAYTVHYKGSLSNANIGDIALDNGFIRLYNGTAWSNAISAVSQLQNDVGYISAHQSLEDYYTKSQTLELVPTKTSQLSNDSGFLTAHQSLEDYAMTTYVDNKCTSLSTSLKGQIPTKTSQLENDSAYITTMYLTSYIERYTDSEGGHYFNGSVANLSGTFEDGSTFSFYVLSAQ